MNFLQQKCFFKITCKCGVVLQFKMRFTLTILVQPTNHSFACATFSLMDSHKIVVDIFLGISQSIKSVAIDGMPNNCWIWPEICMHSVIFFIIWLAFPYLSSWVGILFEIIQPHLEQHKAYEMNFNLKTCFSSLHHTVFFLDSSFIYWSFLIYIYREY